MRKCLCIALISLFLISCRDSDKTFSGYIDVDLVYLSSDFAGCLVNLPVNRGQTVDEHQTLFKLEQTSELYNVKMSEFNTKELQAQREQILVQLNYNDINYHRTVGMRKMNAASQNDLDIAGRDLKRSRQELADINAKIQSNQVNTAQKKWVMTRKENSAPEAGIVFDTYYTKGEFVQAGNPVLSLVTKDHIKVVFFVPEERLAQIRLNQHVNLKTDVNNLFATGHVFYISNIAEFTPPIIYSREERHKLVFRVEAKIDTPDLEKIHLGQPVTLELT